MRPFTLVLIVLPFYMLFQRSLRAQDDQSYRIRVDLADKDDTPYRIDQPEAFLSRTALRRRKRSGMPVTRRDLPIAPGYLYSLREAGYRIWARSKWFNFAVVGPRAQQPTSLGQLKFVAAFDTVRPSLRGKSVLREAFVTDTLHPAPDDPRWQLRQVQLDRLHQRGFDGQGVGVAILDAGFLNAREYPAYIAAEARSGFLEAVDLVAQKPTLLYEASSHGSQVWSVVAAAEFGSAPGADYAFYRTEDVFSEYPVEELYWIAALERADSLGIDVVNTSLSYRDFDQPRFDHPFAAIDGRTTRASRASTLAARRGMVLVTSAGNSGRNQRWPWVGIPADADSILTVGAVRAEGTLAPFSSRGPTADGRIKPDVVARGQGTFVRDARSLGIAAGSGTSYSAPIVAGGMACLRQAFPELPAQTLVQAVRQTATRNTAPDTAFGYGLARFEAAYQRLMTLRDSLEQLANGSFPLTVSYQGGQLYAYARETVAKYRDFRWRLVDLRGRTLTEGHLELGPGTDRAAVSIPRAYLQAGLHLLELASDASRKTFKVPPTSL